MENPGFAAPAVPRADGAAYEVENPGFAAPPIPRADGAAYGVENPGFAFLGDDDVDQVWWSGDDLADLALGQPVLNPFGPQGCRDGGILVDIR